MTPPNPHLLSLSTADPAYALGQEEVADRARRLFAERTAADLDRLMPVFANAGIERRYSCVPIDWYEQPHGWTERNALYLETRGRSARASRAQRRCDSAELIAAEIDAIVAVSTTGIATPSLDALLMERMGLRRDVQRLPIFGLGCAGGVIGIARAADLGSGRARHARAVPGRRALRPLLPPRRLPKSNIVATALFGDGAAAALVSYRWRGSGAGRLGRAHLAATRSTSWAGT